MARQYGLRRAAAGGRGVFRDAARDVDRQRQSQGRCVLLPARLLDVVERGETRDGAWLQQGRLVSRRSGRLERGRSSDRADRTAPVENDLIFVSRRSASATESHAPVRKSGSPLSQGS